IAFAGGAFLQCPLTFDDSAFRQSVESLDVNIIPQGGTALAEAIDTANDAFKEGENYKVLVLITDGEDHDSGAVEAARKAAAKGMDIFTIGVGTPAGELLQVTDANGNTDYIRDDQGNVVKSHLNEKLLREIAGATPKGFYLPMRGAKTMETLYEQGLAPIPKSESGDRLVRRYHERFQWPLGLALACLFFEMILPERGRRRRRAGSATEAVAAPVAAALALLAIAIPQDASASPSSAYKAYHAGKYDQALKDYEDALQKRKDDPRLHYDAGAAAYQTKKYDQAQKEFSQALDSPDWKLQGQAYYNLGNTLFHLGAQNQDPANRQRAWEESIQDFENTLKLNPQDPDAKYNRDTVKKLLEELKKQQQQQQQQQNQNNKNDKKDQKQDQKDQQNQNQNQQNKQNQSKQDQSKDNQQKQNQSSKQDQQSNPDKKQDQARNEQQRKKDEEKARQEAQKQEKPQGGEQKNGEQGQAYAAGEMTPQEAAQLLDAQKGHEMMMPIKPDVKRHPHAGPIKDW
ncbi:MAG TPA: VWA domain-containing protein, partial [Verrucomicrobiae bacterium]|nr:VWA domain-containing protein [Verrucomicrobiae bacterium]